MSISKSSIKNISSTVVVRLNAEITKRGKWKAQSRPNITERYKYICRLWQPGGH